MPKFTVQLEKTITYLVEVEIEAADQDKAEALAVRNAEDGHYDCNWSEEDENIESVNSEEK